MKKHIVIIEDDADDLKIFLDTVNEIPGSFKCTHSNCPAKGLNMLQYLEVDYIFVDYNLPGINGVDLICEIRKDPRFSNTPIYLLSSSITPLVRRSAEIAGVTECYKKPNTQKEMNAMLSEILVPTECPTLLLYTNENLSPEAKWVKTASSFYRR